MVSTATSPIPDPKSAAVSGAAMGDTVSASTAVTPLPGASGAIAAMGATSSSGSMPGAVGSGAVPGNTSTSGSSDGVIVPAEARQKYPDLVELILKSESMNTEERNYWLQVLPVMTKEQIEELRDILETEKKKLAAIDKKYNITQVATTTLDPAEVEKKRREARAKRLHEEKAQQKTEEQIEKDLLGQLSTLT